jgi:hypothetical protein
MRRLIISVAGGLALAVGLLTVVGEFLTHEREPPVWIGWLLYWSLPLLDLLPLRVKCSDANSISEKLGCAWVSLLADVLAFSLVIYVLPHWRKKRNELR